MSDRVHKNKVVALLRDQVGERVLFGLVDSPNFLIQIGHAFYIVNCNRTQGVDRRQYWLMSLIMAWLRTTGGSTLRSLILGQKPPLVSDKRVMPMVALVWYLMYHSPSDIISRLYNTPIISGILAFIEALAKVRAVTGGVENCVKNLPGSDVAAIVLGTLSGCGGTLLADVEKKTRGVVGVNFTKPGYVIKACFWSALVYYILADPSRRLFKRAPLGKRAVKVLIVSVLIYGYVMRAVVNNTFNPFKKLEDFFYKITRIPEKVD